MAKRYKKKKKAPEVRTSQVAVAELKEQLIRKEIPRRKNPALNWKIILQALIIVAAVLWIYWPAFHGGWLWDDDLYITDNPLVRDPARLWKAWFEPGSFIEYYPIQETVQWAQWQLWGMDTLGYHLTNVFLHILSALLVWRLLSKFGLRLAWLGGLIFAIHPVQVESVAWIAELKNALSLPPFLLAMCAWIDFEERGKARDYWQALGLFLVAMLCKITMAPFPLIILLNAWWKRGRIGWREVGTSLPFWLISLLLGFITIWAGQIYESHGHTDPNEVLLGGLLSRLACAGLSLSFYFSKCFLPVHLMPIYPQWQVAFPTLDQFLPWPVLGGLIYWLWTKRLDWGRHALLGLGFFFILLAPFLGFKSISYMSFTWVMDHFLYLPIIGLIGLVVVALGQIEVLLPPSFRNVALFIAFSVTALMAFQSRDYAALYTDSETLWTYEVQNNPDAYLAQNNLGNALVKTGRISEGIDHFEASVRLQPNYAEAHNNMGIALFQMGQVPQAIEQFGQALQIRPEFAEAHSSLGIALQQTGHVPEAILQFEQALQIKPDYADAHNNLGNVLLQVGRMPEATEQYREALRLMPDNAKAHFNLGNALQQTGQLSEAIAQFDQALQIDPNYVEAHNNLGGTLLQAGHPQEAIDQFEQALRIDPTYAAARSNLAKLQAVQKSAPAKN